MCPQLYPTTPPHSAQRHATHSQLFALYLNFNKHSAMLQDFHSIGCSISEFWLKSAKAKVSVCIEILRLSPGKDCTELLN